MTTVSKIIKLGFVLGLFVSCANNTQEINSNNQAQILDKKVITSLPTDSPQDDKSIISEYELYRIALNGLRQEQISAAYRFLSTQKGRRNSMVHKIRLGLLKILGKNSSYGEFINQYVLLPDDVNDLEVNCYAALADNAQNGISLTKISQQWTKSNEKLPVGCNTMIEAAASKGLLNEHDAWRRVRILIANNYIIMAQRLASAIGQPISGTFLSTGSKAAKIEKIISGITPKGRNRSDIDSFIRSLYGKVDQDDIGFVEGIVGLAQARDLNMQSALEHFNKADKLQLSKDQWEWYARSALRLQQWNKLNEIIQHMPKEVRDTPVWQYWQGRSKTALGNQTEANILYEKAANSGRNFYSILAHEALGRPVNVVSNATIGNSIELMTLTKDEPIHRALVLFRLSLFNADQNIREAAREQWLLATQYYSDNQLILASQLALQHQFYDMSIHSADMSDGYLYYPFRFPAPYKNIIDRYSSMYGIESALVLGLIRQESHFVATIKSSMGAVGLMQIMPKTADWIARQIDLDDYHLNDIDTNINIGIWYLAHLYQVLGSEVLAISAYNAGPGRAKKWRQNGLEGAIYVETIPFNETRDYVKKVMRNTFYYSHILGLSQQTFKSRLGSM